MNKLDQLLMWVALGLLGLGQVVGSCTTKEKIDKLQDQIILYHPTPKVQCL